MPHDRPRILVVSKPLCPPWNDGSKNLARDLVEGLAEVGARYSTEVFAPRDAWPRSVGTVATPTPRAGRRTLARIALTLATERESAAWHFFFAPNARTSAVARALRAARGRPTVQTIASAPSPRDRLGELAFGDRVVALSRATEARALEEGVDPTRLVRIPTATRAPARPSASDIEAARARHGLGTGSFVVCFAGDLEHGRGADVLLDACGQASRRGDVVLALACRAKTSRGEERRRELSVRAAALRVALRWVGETPAIHAVLAASDLVALPADTLFAKVDHPLVLLEAQHLGRPVLVTEGTSAFELAEEGGALGAPFDAEAIAACIDRLVSNADERAAAGARAGIAGRARSVGAMARAYESLYEGLLR
jgi:phosphatidylinositol alpha-1,6-mannosyltransferase